MAIWECKSRCAGELRLAECEAYHGDGEEEAESQEDAITGALGKRRLDGRHIALSSLRPRYTHKRKRKEYKGG